MDHLKNYKIAIIGVTSLVGHEIATYLAEAGVPVDHFSPLTSKRQANKEISFGDCDTKTINIDEFDFTKVDLVFYAPDGLVDKDVVLNILDKDVKVVDVSGIMMAQGQGHDNLVCLPSSRALQLFCAIQPLSADTTITRVHVATYEATSTEGKDGMDELFNQSRKFFVSDGMEHNVFGKQIAFNVIPQIDDFVDGGQTQAEMRLIEDTKILFNHDVKVSASCVQVPVFMGTGMTVTIECDHDIDVKQARTLWRENDETIVIDRESEMEYVTPAEIAGEESVFISRIRRDEAYHNGLSFWCVADPIRLMAHKAVEKAENALTSSL